MTRNIHIFQPQHFFSVESKLTIGVGLLDGLAEGLVIGEDDGDLEG